MQAPVQRYPEMSTGDREGQSGSCSRIPLVMLLSQQERISYFACSSGRTFHRATVIWPLNPAQPATQHDSQNSRPRCYACGTPHPVGYCPLKAAGEEYCNLCGLAHFGQSRTCPHIRSETQVRDMLSALKQSTESKYLIDAATKYLKGVKGHLVAEKKKRLQKAAELNAQAANNIGRHDESHRDQPSFDPVSYTHLTLPTIYSV